ncbi:hypothetical protein JM18_005995 [Phytophthora kernoviae]|uniref:mRNA export factor GLE1 n=2 Tax=Phytophthora kernoviae TaxID=325452 RepID=A0A921SG67_9STRA|nr:hypothetical protein G195_007798 [Phytophthora kernoviae 00238/432]KAG2522728.1 hypothetical protein JM18_005995 [Phytophthora kernoviae]
MGKKIKIGNQYPIFCSFMRFGVPHEEEAGEQCSSAPRGVFDNAQSVEKPRAHAISGRGRFRAPSFSSSTTYSDDEDESESDSESSSSDDHSVHETTSALQTLQLTARTRQELVKQVERACERKAVQAVTGSGAYQALCETLQRARQDAEDQLQRVDTARNGQEVDVLQKHKELERRATNKLQQIRSQERSALENVEKELRVFQQARQEEARREEEKNKREEAAVRREEEAREKRLQEAKDKEKALEVQHKAAQELEEAQAKAKVQAAERAAAKKQQEVDREKEETAKKAAQKEAEAQAKQYVADGRARIKRLEELHRHTTEILDNPDPSVKKIRMQIKREAGVCNQIAAAPSAIKHVVSKIQQLLQMAKTSGEPYFKFALDMVASNLSKQVGGRADYKSCYPIAHVIKMSCVQTPELTDVMLGYFHKTCVFTIPDNPEKHASQTIAEYKISVGFQKAVGESSDPDGLEHVTEYTRRMTMISAVLAAVRQTTPWNGSSAPPGLDLGDCWSWLARLMNEPPHLMTGALILTILEVAGFELLRSYKSQFHKLLVLIARDVCPRLSKNAKTGAANAAGQLEIDAVQ